MREEKIARLAPSFFEEDTTFFPIVEEDLGIDSPFFSIRRSSEGTTREGEFPSTEGAFDAFCEAPIPSILRFFKLIVT